MTRCDRLSALINDDEAILISSYPNIFYYSGFTSEDAYLLITKNQRLLFTDSRYTLQARVECPDFEIVDISKTDDTIKAISPEHLCIEEDFITVKSFSKIQKLCAKPKPFAKEIRSLRRVKDTDEIKKIAQAQKLGDEAFSYILNRIKTGKTEKEVATELEFFMRKNGASATSFATICASGVRSAMPHGVASDKVIQKVDFLTLEFGCVLDGYCSDMTRTVVIGTADQRQKEIYEIVLSAQKAALEKAAPNVKCSECDKAARDIITVAGYGENFGHSTGHSVGIEIHEFPVLSPKSEDILEEGNIVTVEPGIYINDFGGVRIEDLIQITSENMVNLTNSQKDLLII